MGTLTKNSRELCKYIHTYIHTYTHTHIYIYICSLGPAGADQEHSNTEGKSPARQTERERERERERAVRSSSSSSSSHWLCYSYPGEIGGFAGGCVDASVSQRSCEPGSSPRPHPALSNRAPCRSRSGNSSSSRAAAAAAAAAGVVVVVVVVVAAAAVVIVLFVSKRNRRLCRGLRYSRRLFLHPSPTPYPLLGGPPVRPPMTALEIPTLRPKSLKS